MSPLIIPYNNVYPKISKSSFIAPNVVIVGDVEIGDHSSIWFGCVIRADVAKIIIGEKTNIQDGTIIHVTRNGFDTVIGSKVTIGHKSLLHACHIEDASFIGMSSTIMDRTVVKTGAMIAAGSLVTQNKVINSKELWAGSPAKFLRYLNDAESQQIITSCNNYVTHTNEYLTFFKKNNSAKEE